jgi:hypothetical protein
MSRIDQDALLTALPPKHNRGSKPREMATNQRRFGKLTPAHC